MIPSYLILEPVPPFDIHDERGPFAAELPAWQRLGLRAIVEGVDGNGTLEPFSAPSSRLPSSQLPSSRHSPSAVSPPTTISGQLLTVWPEDQECPDRRPAFDDSSTWIQIDDSLWIGWRVARSLCRADAPSAASTGDTQPGETPGSPLDGASGLHHAGTAEQPGPADLCNGNPLALRCTPVTLADGHVWQIPQLRDPGGSLLPRDLIRDRKTKLLQSPIKRDYEQLWAESEYWFDLLWRRLEGPTQFSLERALAFATQVLSLRYRFCDATQAALRVIDSVNVQAIIRAALGWSEVLELLSAMSEDVQKKSNQSSPSLNGNSGPEASALTTSQPAENSGAPPSAQS